ncbi:MAG: trypsin-like peptidase domain-containing protein [Marmoricola sp.]
MRRLLLLVLLITTVLVPGPTGGADAAAKPIGPGVQIVVHGAQCTGNFVFRRKGHPHQVFVGMAAHCVGKGSESDTDGCSTPSYPLGTPAQFVVGGNAVDGGTVVGTGRVRYSSWIAMHRAGTSAAAVCASNDFALVQVDRKDLGRVSPTVPQLGGPVGLGKALPAAGSTVYTLGSSSLRGTTEAKAGTVSTRSPWTMTVRTASPGVPGDSGSGFLDATGHAVGVLSRLDLFPDVGANGVGSLPLEVAFARKHGVSGLRLATGAPFTPQAASATAAPAGVLGLLGLG